MAAEINADTNLALASNISDIRVRHYVLLLHPQLLAKRIHGKIILMLDLPTMCEKVGQNCTVNCNCKVPLAQDNEQSTSINLHHECVKSELTNDSEDFKMVLDLKDIHVQSVSEVKHETDLTSILDPMTVKCNALDSLLWFQYERKALEFEFDSSSIKIWKTDVKTAQDFPKVIYLEYHTHPKGNSLSWCMDQDGNNCMFVAGSAINNRSLLPYQDAPSALATWQANVLTDASQHLAITGDEMPSEITSFLNDETMFFQSCLCFDHPDEMRLNSSLTSLILLSSYTALPLPLATLAMAIGKWQVQNIIGENDLEIAHTGQNNVCWKGLDTIKCNHASYPCIIRKHLDIHTKNQGNSTTTDPVNLKSAKRNISDHSRIVSRIGHRGMITTKEYTSKLLLTSLCYPASLQQKVKPLTEFLPHCVAAASQILGPHPCPRLEIVVLPSTYHSLGLASPNLVFLSPSVALVPDSSMFTCVAHEISHAWFGIILGALDWTEEWLSEGFATFMEDCIFTLAWKTYKASLAPAASVADHPTILQIAATSTTEMPPGEDLPTISESPSESLKTSDNTYILSYQASLKTQCNTTATSERLIGGAIETFTELNSAGNDQSTSGSDVLDQISSNQSYICNKTERNSENMCTDGRFLLKNRTKYLKRTPIKDDVDPDDHNSVSLCPRSLLNITDTMLPDLAEIRSLLRYRKLMQEIEVSSDELQTLQPNKSSSDNSFVLNALQKDKMFLQVHYIKGYFLLKYLSNSVGEVSFLEMLRDYVMTYHGQLVTSQIFIDFFYQRFPNFSVSTAKNELLISWLHKPGCNEDLKKFALTTNDSISICKEHYRYWIEQNNQKSIPQANANTKSNLAEFCFSDQINLLLEYMLEYKGHLKKRTMFNIKECYDISSNNCEITHAWCELVIKHNYQVAIEDVVVFLKQEFGMGVYLYGELMIAKQTRWNELAKRVFSEICHSMDDNTKTVVQEMLYPS